MPRPDNPARVRVQRPGSYGDGESSEGRQSGRRSAVARTYETAVSEGHYQRGTGGLAGKYDNVRRYWEDQITRYSLHDFVEPLVQRKRRALSRVRVLDLGSGAGQGYEILTSLKQPVESLASKYVEVLPSDIIGEYRGVDISRAMVEQGRKTYADDPKVDFTVGDLSKGLGPIGEEPPYDIYFSSYGSLSHLRDEELRALLEDVLAHMEGSCVLVVDLVGRFSFEWQRYWEEPDGNETMRQYSMSYLYPNGAEDDLDVERFPLRYWGAEEFDRFLDRTITNLGAGVAKKRLWDRSVLVGRHMDTGEFNSHAQPLRFAVNKLHEFDRRTDLESLLFDYTPHRDFPVLNRFFESFQIAWNTVVHAAIEALERWDDSDWLREPPSEDYPAPVRQAIHTVRNVIRHIQWFRMGDPRANVVEPQLGYVLRNLEMDMQRGLGVGHGLLAIYELQEN